MTDDIALDQQALALHVACQELTLALEERDQFGQSARLDERIAQLRARIASLGLRVSGLAAPSPLSHP